MNYYNFHIGDYAKQTRYLTLLRDIAYRRMIDTYYVHEGPLEGTAESIAESIGMSEYVSDVAAVLKQFFTASDAGWVNGRCDEEIERMNKAAEQARLNGAQGGRPIGAKDKKKRTPKAKEKPNNPAGTQREPDGNRMATGWKATQYPVPNTQDPSHSVPDGTGDKSPIVPPPQVGEAVDPVPSSFPDKPQPALEPPSPPQSPDGKLFAAANGPFLPRPQSDFTDMTDEIWGVGKDWLAWCGIADKTAGNHIGLWLRKARDKRIVIDAIFAGIRAGTRDPVPFVTKIIGEANKGRGQKEYAGDLRGMNYDTTDSQFDTSEQF